MAEDRGHEPAVSGRFALDPLVARSGFAAIAASGGVTRRTLYRWRHSGLTLEQTDELAIRCGLHPSEVWPDF